MSENKRNWFLIFGFVLLVAIFNGCVEEVSYQQVAGQVNMEALETLFSKYNLSLNTNLEEVSIHSMNGVEVASQRGLNQNASFSFKVPSGNAYFLKARTVDGVNLWAITPLISQDTVQEVDLNTTYEATLIVASLGTIPPTRAQVDDLKQNATLALNQDVDRLVKTVKRIVDHALLKRIDYSPLTEAKKENLRAFAGGLEPIRSLDAILESPEPDFIPYIYAGRFTRTHEDEETNNILITEIKAERWDYLVQGSVGVRSDWKCKYYSIEDNPYVTHGGTTLVFTSTRHCLEDPCPCIGVRGFASIYTIPLNASADTLPKRLTPASINFAAISPIWSWDEEKIVFAAGSIAKEEWMDVEQTPEEAPWQIYVMNKDGTGQTQLTFDEDPSVWNKQPAWSPDNKQIVYTSNRTGDTELWIMNSDGSGNTQLTNSPGSHERGPRFSPDGREIAFESDRDGDWELFLMDRDGSNWRQLTSNNIPDIDASWAHNGLDIVYTSGEVYQDRYEKKVAMLAGLNTLTGETLFDLGDFANALSYEDPVWAATNHVLIPSKKIVAADQSTPEGYVAPEGGASRTAGANPSVQGAFEIKENPQDPLSAYRHEIYSAAPDFVPPPMTW